VSIGVAFRGWRELDRALGELPKATAKNVLRRTSKAALEPMANQAAALAPQQSGRLSFSISVSERGTRRAEWLRAKARFSFVMAMGPAGGTGALQYAAFKEFGTIKMSPEPFMRPAWDGGKVQMLEFVKVELGNQIDAAARRLARKRTTGA
jgi:HK97 gp10 family phage protein